MAIDPVRGVLVWTATADQLGVHDVILRVKDNVGGVALQPFQVTVVASNTPSIITSSPLTKASVEAGPVIISLDPAATYLRTNQDDSRVAVPIDLRAIGLLPGDLITLESLGSWLPHPTLQPMSGLLGVFSASNVLLASPNVNRVRDAVDAGLDFETISTFIGGFPTDIPEDFEIPAQANGVTVEIPKYASFLFVSVHDSLYNDNSSPIHDLAVRVQRGTPYRYFVRAQDADGDILSYRLDKAPSGMTINSASGEVRWNATTAQVGKHSIVIVADDGRGGAAKQEFDLQVIADSPNNSPAFTSTPRKSIQIDRRYVYAAEAIDPNGDPLSYSLPIAPAGMTIDANGLVQWQPTANQFGVQAVSIQVDDGRGGFTRQDYTINVTAQQLNSAPSIVSNPRFDATLGKLYQYDAQATDADGDSLIWNLRSGPRGLSIDPNRGTIRWTPTLDQLGQQTVELDVLDGQGGTATQRFTLMVRSSNLPPLFESSPPTKATIGRPYVYEAVAIDPDGDGLTITLIQSPIGMSLDLATGLLNWVPETEQLGPHEVELLVTDSRGATVHQTYTVVVSELAEDAPPVITSSPVLAGLVGSTYTYLITADDPEGQSLSFGLTTAPTDMTIVGSTLQWSPTTSDVGDHLVIRSSDGSSG